MQEDLLELFKRYVEIVGTRKARATMMRAIGDKLSKYHLEIVRTRKVSANEHNPLHPWIVERCLVSAGHQEDCGRCYEDFVAWYGKPISRVRFGAYLRDTGHVRRVSARGYPSGSVYRGIGLRTD